MIRFGGSQASSKWTRSMNPIGLIDPVPLGQCGRPARTAGELSNHADFAVLSCPQASSRRPHHFSVFDLLVRQLV